MKKIFCVMMLAVAIIAGGCSKESSFIESTGMEIHMECENYNGMNTDKSIEVDGTLLVETKIKHGQIEFKVGNKNYTFDKTQETSIDLPIGNYNVSFVGHDDFTGEITLRALPKV